MLTVKHSHSQYQNFIKTSLDKFYIQPDQQITLLENNSILTKMWSTDLTRIVPLLQSTYSKSTQGTPPKDAILSGFIPSCYFPYKAEGIVADKIPGVGTFYDFMDRLIRKDKNLYKSKLRKFKRKPRKKQKKNQKMDSSKPGVVQRLVKRVLKYDNTRLPAILESTLNTVLKDL